MAETLPDPDARVEPHRGAAAGTSRWQKLVGILGVLVILWVGNDTYKVIDGDFGGGAGGGHRPDQEAPVGNQDQETDTDDGGGGHRPPGGGHG